MADQTVRVSNMPDSGSAERVAFMLYADLSHRLPSGGSDEEKINRSLALYAKCLKATKGYAVEEPS